MSRLSLLFAGRYLRSRKSLSVINIISRVSIFAICVPVAAMVILLSVFNGFEGLVRSMYNSFDPDILITSAEGKVFDVSALDQEGLRSVEGVREISYVLEESVMMEYRGRQTIGILRGVDSLYSSVVPMEDLIIRGKYELLFGDMQQTVVGQGIAYDLGVRTEFYNTFNVYAPRRGEFSSLLPIESFSTGRLFPAGIFALDAETDGTYALSTIEFAREMLDYPDKASRIMVALEKGAKPDAVKRRVTELAGDNFRVQNRYEQKASMYQIMKYEKWGIFFIALLILIIAAFSIVGSLVMLIIDKRPDMRMIISMGGDITFVRRIFIEEGMLIGAAGTLIGILVGVLVCWVQQQFGLVKLGADSFLVSSYPVEMRWQDIGLIVITTLVVNWIITKFTVVRMIPRSAIRL